MNRLQSVDFELDTRRSIAHESTCYSASRFHQRVPLHQFFIPLHYENNYAYPLFVWLHGPRSNEQEMNHVMPHLSLRNYVGLSLRGVVTDDVLDRYGETTFTWDQEPASIDYAAEDILSCIDLAKERFHIAANRVFLVGNDVGGTMALRLALSMPEHFNGVVSIGGSLPQSNAPFRRIIQARSLPILIAQGRDSDVYLTDQVCRDLRLLHSAGCSVALRQYPCEQEVTTQMLADVNAWMMEQVCGVAGQPVVVDDPTHMRLEDHN